MSDTPRVYCSGCEPEADPVAAFLAHEYCFRHVPTLDGLDDGCVSLGPREYADVPGDNQHACDAIHRPRE